VAPGLTADALSLVNRVLPGPGRKPTGRHKGEDSQSRLSPSWLSRLGDRAARKYNQVATRKSDRVITSAGSTPE
jgi:hypothetical protein